jgi:1-deoxy-D-xylulose-5-phosphate reductoisomerase
MRLGDQVVKVILTASGGPFRTWPRERVYNSTPEQALKHPTWTMGRKVTIDSASLTNKALEIIEAHWLFGVPADRIEAIIHPQSIVHAIVEMADGSCIAQLGAPDMRGPIQYALSFPHRPPGGHRRLPWHELRTLEFEPPDHERFPALRLAYRAIREGGTAGAVLNAANEAAVEVFLAGAIPFGRITELTAQAMDALGLQPVASLDDVLGADAGARAFVRERVG